MGNSRIGAAEKVLYTAGDRALDAGRKFYTQTGLKNALARAVRKAVKDAGINRLQSMGKRFLMKLVPGLNTLSTALDIYMTAQDIYDIINLANDLLDDALRIQPDFSVIDAESGSVTDVYDFKFDREGYRDTLSDSQKRLYQNITGKVQIEFSDATCNCAARAIS